MDNEKVGKKQNDRAGVTVKDDEKGNRISEKGKSEPRKTQNKASE